MTAMPCAARNAFDSRSVKGVPLASRSRQSEAGASVCGSADGAKRACAKRRLIASRLARAPCMTATLLPAKGSITCGCRPPAAVLKKTTGLAISRAASATVCAMRR